MAMISTLPTSVFSRSQDIMPSKSNQLTFSFAKTIKYQLHLKAPKEEEERGMLLRWQFYPNWMAFSR